MKAYVINLTAVLICAGLAGFVCGYVVGRVVL